MTVLVVGSSRKPALPISSDVRSQSAAAQALTRRLVAEGATALLSFGRCGGLDPALQPGTLLVPAPLLTRDKCYAASPDVAADLRTHGAAMCFSVPAASL